MQSHVDELIQQATNIGMIINVDVRFFPTRFCSSDQNNSSVQKYFLYLQDVYTITITADFFIAPPTKWTGVLNNKSYAYE